MNYNKLIAGLLITFIGGSSSLVLAGKKVDYVNLRPAGIHFDQGKVGIKLVNGKYGVATKTTTPFYVQVRAACKGKNMLKKVYVAFGTENANGSILEYSNNYKKTILTGFRKTLSWTNVKMIVPLSKLTFNPAQLCQNYVKNKVAQGVSLQQILRKDKAINRSVKLSAVASCGKKNKDKYKTIRINRSIKIICKAGSIADINKIKAKTPKLGKKFKAN
ncbi:hypothetical protein MNBD_GAMMA12-2937 [hydrothermal vent metagenome]|uniref:Uncharacterized protein n=1 Tax=hydrothermal vent metagenome TaxID=652676 RepID=A0A3B0YLN2_9ZZZZ